MRRLTPRATCSPGSGTCDSCPHRAPRRARYDVALDLQGLLKSAVLARASGAARVVGFSSAYAREWLAPLLYTETREPGGVPHVVFQNLALLEALDVTVVSPEFPIER